MTLICPLTHRSLIKVIGSDSFRFLNGLVTAKIEAAPKNNLIYGAFLRPQGKIITDCLFWARSDTEVWLEIATHQSSALIKSLNLYKLRANVDISIDDTKVNSIFCVDDNTDYLKDPRSEIIKSGAFGRYYGDIMGNCTPSQWIEYRFKNCIFESDDAFGTEKFYAPDANLDLMGGVDFHKGCYVGQELTSRMKRRAQIKNRLMTIKSAPRLESGAEITQLDQVIGNVVTFNINYGIGLIRIDRYDSSAKTLCNGAEISIVAQPWQAE